MRKFLLLLLTLTLVFTSVLFVTSCKKSKDKIKAGEGLEYTLLDNDTYEISGIGSFTGTNLVISSSYNGKPVTSIGSSAFSDCRLITSVTIPNSVISIGEDAFSNCWSLKYIYYTGDINSWLQISSLGNLMGASSFFKNLYINGTLLTEANITTATSIPSYAFYGCTSLTKVTIGDQVTRIGDYAFSGCTSLTSVTFKNTNGWYRYFSSTSISGTSVDVTDSSQNATYLKSTYDNYYWKRTNG